MFTFGQKIRMQSAFDKDAPREGLAKSKFKCYEPKKNLLEAPTIAELATAATNEQRKLSVALLPNPADQSFKVNINNPSFGKLLLSIYNANGQLMEQQISEIAAGQHQYNYNSSKWPTGIYLVHTVVNGQNDVQRLVIVKP
jgi:hypothetical protein